MGEPSDTSLNQLVGHFPLVTQPMFESIIEEIIRISGFTDLNARLPISVQKGKVPKIVQLKQKFRKAFVNFGLNEVMHFTLASKHEIMQPILKNPILSLNNEQLQAEI